MFARIVHRPLGHSAASTQLLQYIKHATSNDFSPTSCSLSLFHHRTRRMFASSAPNDEVFEMGAATLRYGNGVTSEVGMDFANMGAAKVCLMTDPKLLHMEPVKVAREALDKAKVNYEVFSDVSVEPTDQSLLAAIHFCKAHNFDAYLAVGGGSVIDTCKGANLYASLADTEDINLLQYIPPPIGNGSPITHRLRPLIAVPTTAGTGSETTGSIVFDMCNAMYKVGISNRAVKPSLALIDPLHTLTLPPRVMAYPGLDVLCHSVESYTARPYNQRPKPDNPLLRPLYQGSNPISDVWVQQALHLASQYLIRAVNNSDDLEARSAMLLASSNAGVGFGNAGVHLCHALSYPISGLVKDYTSPDYDPTHPLIPHGLSVTVTCPAVFRFTAHACPQRHLDAAKFIGADTSNVRLADAGKLLGDTMLQYLHDLDVPNGLSALGYTADDIPALAKGAIIQRRLINISPCDVTEQDLEQILHQSLTIY